MENLNTMNSSLRFKKLEEKLSEACKKFDLLQVVAVSIELGKLLEYENVDDYQSIVVERIMQYKINEEENFAYQIEIENILTKIFKLYQRLFGPTHMSPFSHAN